jgi:hypothetical protein
VNKVGILCVKDREMIHEFGGRCIENLKGHLPLRIILSAFQKFFDENVRKEVDKDKVIIEQTASLFEAGRSREELDLDAVFRTGKEIDDKFVSTLSFHSFEVHIRYGDIAEIRKSRIAAVRDAVYDLLGNWGDYMTFPAVVTSTYDENGFAGLIRHILNLYSLETRSLTNSLHFHKPIDKVKDLFTAKLFSSMDTTAQDLARDYTRRIFSGKGLACSSRT